MFGKTRKLVGLDIGSSALKAVELKKRKGGYALLSLGLEPVAPELVGESAIRDVAAMSTAIGRLFEEQKIVARDVATSVAGHAVIVKQLAAPTLGEPELREWAHSTAAQQIPFEPTDVRLSFQFLDGNPELNGRQLLLVAAKKEKVDSHAEAIRRAGRNPVVMDIDACALANCYEANYEPNPSETIALVDLGAKLANIIVVRNGVPLFTRDIAVGGWQYTDALQREFGLEYEEAERVKRGESDAVPADQLGLVAHSFLEMVVEEICRSFEFFRSGGERSDGQPPGAADRAGPNSPPARATERIDRILVTGGSSRLPKFIEMLYRRFPIPVEELDPLRHVEIPSDQFDETSVRRLAPQLAVSVGLALRSGEPA